MARSPLFDIYDPYGILQQQAEMGLLPSEEDGEPLGIVPLGPRKARISDLMPEEEQKGLLQNLAAAGSSGLSGLGWILDTPGAMVRGLLSGGPGKAISALWDTTDERVDGRELLRQYGMVRDEDNWGNFGGGLAAEVLLDPLTYASFGLNQILGQGARTAAGKAAAKAGLLQDVDVAARRAGTGTRQFLRNATPESLLGTLADDGAREAARRKIVAEAGEEALSQKITRSNRYWIPGVGEGATDLYGQRAGDFLAWAGDALGDTIMTNPYTGAAARRLYGTFNETLGQTSRQNQLDARGLLSDAQRREAGVRSGVAALAQRADAALRPFNLSMADQDVSLNFRYALEDPDYVVPESLQAAFETPAMQEYLDWARGTLNDAPARARERGIPLDTFEPRAGGQMVPRQQSAFDVIENPTWPQGVLPPENIRKPYGRANKPVSLSDSAGRRRDYTDVVGQTRSLNQMSVSGALQEALRGATPAQTQEILRGWARDNLGVDDIYSWIDDQSETGRFFRDVPDLPRDHPLMRQRADLEQQLEAAVTLGDDALADTIRPQLADIAEQIPAASREAYRDSLYRNLGDFLRKLDPKHSQRNIPIFGLNTFNELASYATRRARKESMGEGLLDILSNNATTQRAADVQGGVNYTLREALGKLGFTDDAIETIERTHGTSVDDLSVNKRFVDEWSRAPIKGRAPEELSPLMELADDYTKSFKTLALANPARLTRDAYSGAFAASMLNSFNPIDWYVGTQIRRGNYRPLTEGMLGGAIEPRLARGHYADLFREDPQRALEQFLSDAAGQGLGTSTVSDEALDGSGAVMRELFPGQARPEWSEIGSRVYNRDRTWRQALSDFNPFAVRGTSGNRNPILELFDRASETTDAGNRFGTYLNQTRQNAAPSEASRIANLTQVDYRPQAFTDFERRYLKRIMPFYSYTRGIMPLIADEVVNRPAGAMGKSIRMINRGGQPSEENFVPEYLRQSAAVPLPADIPFFGLGSDSNLRRFLTNIDLPFESAINLITPGVGNNLYQQAGNTLTKTALNLLGQTNPLIKGPLESVTNRQFYSGRQLSDLYSMLEQTLGAPGRPLEQLIVNAPGGSRLLGTIRQLSDDRLDPSEKASKFLVNALTGLKFQDVDMERTRRLAARDMLNELLSTTPGVRTYENITVPPEVLATMPENQKQMYLLYKIIQSEAAKRARDKKRAETVAADPLQILGAIS